MKLTKSLFLAFAGLGLFACSNEDVATENGGVINGPANVEVKVKLPVLASRTVNDRTFERDVEIESMKITLTCEDGSTQEATYEDFLEEEVNGEGSVVFEGVQAPKSITVSVNGYEKGTELTLSNTNTTWAGVKAPMYGETSSIQAIPSENVYKATVDVEHQQARMEFLDIFHQDALTEDGGVCRFKSLNIVGAFLNDWDNKNTYNSWAEIPWDNNIWDVIGTPEKKVNFLLIDNNNALPDKNQCYAYNVKPGSIPTFTLAFDDVEYTDEYQSAHGNIAFVGDHGYAVVSKYKVIVDNTIIKNYSEFGLSAEPILGQEVEITKLPAGYIYQVQHLAVPDSAIKGDIRGEGVNLIATINVEKWNIVIGHAEWK